MQIKYAALRLPLGPTIDDSDSDPEPEEKDSHPYV
jgi:hypothetical protein